MIKRNVLAGTGGGFSIDINLGEIDLATMPALEGTVIESVIQDLRGENGTWQARHHSHHSYSTHGTMAW